MKLENLKIDTDFVMTQYASELQILGVGDLPSDSVIVHFKIPSFLVGTPAIMFTVHEIINRVYGAADIPLINSGFHLGKHTTEWYMRIDMCRVKCAEFVSVHCRKILDVLEENNWDTEWGKQ